MRQLQLQIWEWEDKANEDRVAAKGPFRSLSQAATQFHSKLFLFKLKKIHDKDHG